VSDNFFVKIVVKQNKHNKLTKHYFLAEKKMTIKSRKVKLFLIFRLRAGQKIGTKPIFLIGFI